MVKNKFFTLLVAITLGVLALTPAFAQYNNTVTGTLKATTEFNKADKLKGKQWFDSGIKNAKDRLSQRLASASPDEAIKIKDALSKLSQETSDKKFIELFDGSANLVTPLPDLEISIGQVSAVTDKEGKFTLVGVPEGKQTLTISFNGSVVRTIQVDVKKDKELIVNLRTNFNSIYEVAQKMSAAPKVKALDTIITSPQYSIGTLITRGTQAMKIVADVNIVACNKAGTTLDSLADFPVNDSDCSQSIAQGTLYAGSPTLYSYFKNSYYCYIEAIMTRDNIAGTNPYCDGKYKSGHYNCSWFFGIWDSEQLHTEW